MTMIRSTHGELRIPPHGSLDAHNLPPDAVVGSAVQVLKSLVQGQLQEAAFTQSQSPTSIVRQLARRLDGIQHPNGRACVIWLVGQYSPDPDVTTGVEGVALWAPDVLRKTAKVFKQEVSNHVAKTYCPHDSPRLQS